LNTRYYPTGPTGVQISKTDTDELDVLKYPV
jgi:hypothetical protein